MATATAGAMGMDPRKRNLMILGGVTALFVVLAGAAVYQQAHQLAPKFAPRAFFPDLTPQLANAGEIAVTTKTGAFHIRLMGDKWVIAERDNFPADPALVRQTTTALAGLETLEPKTARADWLTYIGLAAPDKGGDGLVLKLSDKANKPLAELIVGHQEGMADELGRMTLYVRKPNENQSWLARGYLVPKPKISDWLDKAVLPIARDRVKGATMTPPTGPAYTMVRDSKDQPDFRVLDLPKGRELSFAGVADGVAGAITGFNFDDVTKADQVDFTKPSQLVTDTFDGLNITVKVAAKGMDHWATVSAAAANPMVQAEADRINARANGWAFKLADMSVTQLTSTLDTLLKPLDSGKPAPKPGAPTP